MCPHSCHPTFPTALFRRTPRPRHVDRAALTGVLLFLLAACARYPIPTLAPPQVPTPKPAVTPQSVIVAEPPTPVPPTPTAVPTLAEVAAPVDRAPLAATATLDELLAKERRPPATPRPVPPSFLEQRITDLHDLTRLPLLEHSTVTQFASRNWTALEHYFDYFFDDGAFTSSNYGYLEENGARVSYRMVTGYDGKPEYELVPRVSGPGIVARIWFAYQQHQSINNPTDMSRNEEWVNWGNLGAMGNIRFYFDDEPTPRIDFGIKDLFVGRPPFPAPLAAFYASADGGNINYVPIPFSRSIRIATTGRPRGMQIELKRWPEPATPSVLLPVDGPDGVSIRSSGPADAPARPVQSFSLELAAPERAALDQAAQAWQTCTPRDAEAYQSFALALPHNSSAAVDFPAPATISHLRVRIPSGMDDSVWMQLFWDGETEPSMTAPLRGMFGTAERLSLYRSLPLGIQPVGDELVFYLDFPMPFQTARVLFINDRAETLPLTLEVATRETTPGSEGTRLHAFYGSRRMEQREDNRDNYTLIDVRGSGKYLGTVFNAWELSRLALNGPLDEHWRFPYLESNMDVWVDGRLALPGTGIEDDFNASYYYAFYGYPGYKTTYCLAGVTLLDYALRTEPSSQYRFYLNDAPEFRERLRVEVEHGNKGNNLAITYSSTAFWYQVK